MAALENLQADTTQVVTNLPKPKKNFLKILIPAIFLLALSVAGVLFWKFILPRLNLSESKEVTWWGLWEDEGIVAPLIHEFEEKNPGTKITYLKQAQQDYRERLANSLAKGTGPDIFRFHNTWVPMFKGELDPVPASVMSPAEFSQTFFPVAVSDLTLGTSIVGIPLEYDGLALFINEEIFDRAGLEPPKTWNEFRDTALALTIRDKDGKIQQSGAALGRVENVDHWPEILALMMFQNGAKLTDPQGKLAEESLKFFTLFSTSDKVWNQTLPPSTLAFAGGKLAMYFGPSWRVFEIKDKNKDLKFRVVPVPQLPKEGDSFQPNISYATYWVEGIWSRSKSKKVAWEFLKFLSTRESLEKLYQNASKTRLFGEPYPRIDMASLLSSDPILSVFIAQAPEARSWYLASRTWDGPTGINSQINKYFEDAVTGVNTGRDSKGALATASKGVVQVLSSYGLISSQSK